MNEPARLMVGRIVKAHGIRGEVVVYPESDHPQRFAKGSTSHAGDELFTIEASRPHHTMLLVRFREVADRNGAESLRGTELWIPGEQAAPLPEGSFYPHQLVGASVVTEDGRALGMLVRVDENPAHDLWVVEHDGREVLVPAVKEFVRSVDVDGKRIVLDPPDGMF